MGVVGNYVDAKELGMPGNYTFQAGNALGIMAFYMVYPPHHKGLKTTLPAVFLNSNLDKATVTEYTKVTLTTDLLEPGSDWTSDVFTANIILRTDDFIFNQQGLVFAGESTGYVMNTPFVGARPDTSTPTSHRCYNMRAGETLLDLGERYPTDVIEILRRYGNTRLGLTDNGVVAANGKMIIICTAINESDFNAA